eukprot:TRINITY_DN4766_c0_g2_i5.p1 TRINITY_DN4766_c0_g2~~TRINITY_DN4766_c0_g2_i5.p1  ORF type:complete len:128 (+),score=16.78 TRINITY_DN4766_c0_g2_i5:885-1268(+)
MTVLTVLIALTTLLSLSHDDHRSTATRKHTAEAIPQHEEEDHSMTVLTVLIALTTLLSLSHDDHRSTATRKHTAEAIPQHEEEDHSMTVLTVLTTLLSLARITNRGLALRQSPPAQIRWSVRENPPQ